MAWKMRLHRRQSSYPTEDQRNPRLVQGECCNETGHAKDAEQDDHELHAVIGPVILQLEIAGVNADHETTKLRATS